MSESVRESLERGATIMVDPADALDGRRRWCDGKPFSSDRQLPSLVDEQLFSSPPVPLLFTSSKKSRRFMRRSWRAMSAGEVLPDAGGGEALEVRH
jgi:hypothetical protein